jgi:hypothetical protein
MGFGRNPHVAKAEAAEQKALAARDDAAREQAWREAARQWERAADRETDDKRRQQYTGKAEAARATADGEPLADESSESSESIATRPGAKATRSLLN